MIVSGPPNAAAGVERTDRPPAAGVMQALLFAEILKPLTTALGPVGDAVLGSVAQAAFVRTRS